MPILRPRTRMISIRLSEEEYAALKHICSVTGARSVSELTRDSMHVLLNGASRGVGFGPNVDEFRAEIRRLNKKIEKLATQIAPSKTKDTQNRD